MTIKMDFRQFLAENAHDYSSTQINLPLRLADEIQAWGLKHIPEPVVYKEDGHGRGVETHVTVLYGLHSSTPDEIIRLLKNEKPFQLELGEISMFKGHKYDVVKIEVESDKLHELHEKIRDNTKNTQTFPDYHPHVTISYVKKDKYKVRDKNHFVGKKFTAQEILFSSKLERKTKIPLKQLASLAS
jgi:hypothetical protein